MVSCVTAVKHRKATFFSAVSERKMKALKICEDATILFYTFAVYEILGLSQHAVFVYMYMITFAVVSVVAPSKNARTVRHRKGTDAPSPRSHGGHARCLSPRPFLSGRRPVVLGRCGSWTGALGGRHQDQTREGGGQETPPEGQRQGPQGTGTGGERRGGTKGGRGSGTDHEGEGVRPPGGGGAKAEGAPAAEGCRRRDGGGEETRQCVRLLSAGEAGDEKGSDVFEARFFVLFDGMCQGTSEDSSSGSSNGTVRPIRRR